MPRPKPHHLANYPSTHRLIARREPKPHLVFKDGVWCLYRNWWKSNWPTANCITGKTIAELRKRLKKSHERFRFGG